MTTKTKEVKKTTSARKANEHMSAYIRARRAKARQDEIMKSAAAYLTTYGKEHDDKFDEKGNLQLDGGYLHTAKKSEIVNCDTFDFNKFIADFPELVDYKMKTAAIKAMLQNEAGVKKLTAEHCVTLKTVETLEIVIDK